MRNTTPPQDPSVLSYFGLRKAVGVIGFALPFVLAFGKMIWTKPPGLQLSISAYYYTDMRNIFVGGLCAIALFLFATKGYDHRDAIASRLSCLFALGVAFFPTKPEYCFTTSQRIIGAIHLAFAALLFITLGFFCLFQFTQTNTPGHQTAMKLKRNLVYTLCGYTIFACVALCAIFGLIHLISQREIWRGHLFWFESIAIVAFGFAWLTKGELILKDGTPAQHRTFARVPDQ